ncbi:hypothetical protein T484DRAFT_1755094 [Baffinella frigidus]|nr:hypothetical protein T484DRAFT_1755094 [Cryptophyta sp. CCMP2293]
MVYPRPARMVYPRPARTVRTGEITVFDDFEPSFEDRQREHANEHRRKYGTDGTRAAAIDFLIDEGHTGDAKFYAQAWRNRDRNCQNGRTARNEVAMRGIKKRVSPRRSVETRKYSTYKEKRKILEQDDAQRPTSTVPKRKLDAEVMMYYRLLHRTVKQLTGSQSKTIITSILFLEDQFREMDNLIERGVYSDDGEWLIHERMVDIVEGVYKMACDTANTAGIPAKTCNLYIDIAEQALDFCAEARRQNEVEE